MPRGRYDTEDLVYNAWREFQIDFVVSLTPESEYIEKSGETQFPQMGELGFNIIHLPIIDRGIISVDEIEGIVSIVIQKLVAGHNTVVHCSAGIGRTGIILACILSSMHKWTASESINFLNSLTPSIGPENKQQVELVNSYTNKQI